MEAAQYIEDDLLRDELSIVKSLKSDLIALINRIERNAAAGTLRSTDRTMLTTQCIAMEMSLDEILDADWQRLTSLLGINQPMPRSTGYQAWLARPQLRVPTNPATYEMMGAPL